MTQVLRINVWSGPRNISTALMYSFAQRPDTRVVDEPLYAHYLSHTPAQQYHPAADEVLASQDNDGEAVVRDVILGPCDRQVLFLKQMTHHLVELDLGFLAKTMNVILTRDPVDMLPSYQQQVETPSLRDTGYPQHLELLEALYEIGVEDDGQIRGLDEDDMIASLATLKRMCHRINAQMEVRHARAARSSPTSAARRRRNAPRLHLEPTPSSSSESCRAVAKERVSRRREVRKGYTCG